MTGGRAPAKSSEAMKVCPQQPSIVLLHSILLTRTSLCVELWMVVGWSGEEEGERAAEKGS